MPNYRTHLLGGAVSFVIVYKLAGYCSPEPIQNLSIIGGLGLALLGSIFPDIDVPSRMQTIFYRSMIVVLITTLIFKLWKLFIGASALSCIILFIRHRTITHQIWFLITFPLALLFLIKNKTSFSLNLLMFFYACFVLGALSHILLDFGIKRLFRRRL